MLRIARSFVLPALLGIALPVSAMAQACRAVPSANYALAAGLTHAWSGGVSSTGIVAGLHAMPVSVELAYYTDGLGGTSGGFGADAAGNDFLWLMGAESELDLEVAVEFPPLPAICLTVGGAYVPTEIARFDIDAFGRLFDFSVLGHGRLFRLPLGLAGGHTFQAGPVAIAPAGSIAYEWQRLEIDPFDWAGTGHDWAGLAAFGARYDRFLLTLRARKSLRFPDSDAVFGADFRVFFHTF